MLGDNMKVLLNTAGNFYSGLGFSATPIKLWVCSGLGWMMRLRTYLEGVGSSLREPCSKNKCINLFILYVIIQRWFNYVHQGGFWRALRCAREPRSPVCSPIGWYWILERLLGCWRLWLRFEHFCWFVIDWPSGRYLCPNPRRRKIIVIGSCESDRQVQPRATREREKKWMPHQEHGGLGLRSFHYNHHRYY